MADRDYKNDFQVKNWRLRVFSQKETAKGLMLNCNKSGKKKDDGTWEKGLPMSVFCSFDTCNYDEALGDDASGQYILVDGTFSTSEYIDRNGNASVSITIFATDISKIEYSNYKK